MTDIAIFVLKALGVLVGAGVTVWAARNAMLATLSAAIGKPGTLGLGTAAIFFGVMCAGMAIVWVGAVA
jgi:hypothetical protein